jgi:hypothetical protein
MPYALYQRLEKVENRGRIPLLRILFHKNTVGSDGYRVCNNLMIEMDIKSVDSYGGPTTHKEQYFEMDQINGV